MALSRIESAKVDELYDRLRSTATQDERLLRYYRGAQRVEQLGMAVPPSMRRFLVIVNWPRVVVDTKERRQKVRALILPGEETADPTLRRISEASNLSAQLKLFNRDRQIYGRSFLSVGGGDNPLIRVESPREMAVEVDPRREVASAAARFYGVDEATLRERFVTLYLPGYRVTAELDRGMWYERERVRMPDELPIFMHLHRRMTGEWVGESEMTDIIPLTDSAARTMTNMQFAVEAHGIPRMWMTGVSQGDFVGPDGKPIPAWEAYYDAIHTLTNAGAKVGQLTASDLKNFETALTMYGRQAATLTGFPARYFGLHTSNPPAEGAMRADEAQLVESVDSDNEEVGATLGWAAAYAYRFSGAPGSTEGNAVRVDWHDPGTPTQAQRMDALVKARSVGVLSREGFWDELGWSEARKAKERAYFDAEEADPYLARLSGRADAEV